MVGCTTAMNRNFPQTAIELLDKAEGTGGTQDDFMSLNVPTMSSDYY